MNPFFKKIINLMKCPICGGQLEGISNFYCVYDKKHYALYINNYDVVFQIIKEEVLIFDKLKAYEILQCNTATYIYVYNLDGFGNIINPYIKKPDFTFDKYLFDFQSSNKEKILNRIKTILVFNKLIFWHNFCEKVWLAY